MLGITKSFLINSIKTIKGVEEIVNYKLKPNFNVLGQKYGKEINLIIDELKQCPIVSLINKIEDDDSITLCDNRFELNKEDFEDSVQYPFWSLGLLKQAHGLKQNYQLVKRSVCDIPSSIFNYTLIEYLRLTDQNEAVTFDKLLNDA